MRGESVPQNHRTAWIAFAAALMLAAFGWDYLSGNEISLGLMYVISVAVGAWFGGRGAGIVLAGCGTVAWVASYLLVGNMWCSSPTAAGSPTRSQAMIRR